MVRKLPEIKVTLERIPPDQKLNLGSYPDNVGCCTKFGGDPVWIQGNETPTCPECHQEMVFVGQIDSFDMIGDHNPMGLKKYGPEEEYMFGDAGTIYLFFCYDCLQSKTVLQFY